VVKVKDKIESSNYSSDDEEWRRLEKWHFGRANYS
jgi:hypothetical protein